MTSEVPEESPANLQVRTTSPVASACFEDVSVPPVLQITEKVIQLQEQANAANSRLQALDYKLAMKDNCLLYTSDAADE